MNAAQEQKDKKTLPAVKGREERQEKNKQKQTNDICSSERTAVAARFWDLLPIEAEISKSCKKKRKSRKFQVTSCACQRLGSNIGIPAWNQTTVPGQHHKTSVKKEKDSQKKSSPKKSDLQQLRATLMEACRDSLQINTKNTKCFHVPGVQKTLRTVR